MGVILVEIFAGNKMLLNEGQRLGTCNKRRHGSLLKTHRLWVTCTYDELRLELQRIHALYVPILISSDELSLTFSEGKKKSFGVYSQSEL